VDSTLARVRRASLLIVVALALGALGCGDDDDGNGNGNGNGDGAGGSEALRDAVAKTEAAKTARMAFTVSISGAASERYTGEVLVDFENDRNHLSMDVQGQPVELFADGDDEYVRIGSSGRYQAMPESEQTPVDNNPTDSLQYVGTEVVDVRETEPGCYEGKLDFDRVFERVEEGRESEFPEQLRGYKAPVLVCVDGEGRIRRDDVELSLQGTTVKTSTTVSDHGQLEPLEPLGPDELPR
jgi:hypothetical protein